MRISFLVLGIAVLSTAFFFFFTSHVVTIAPADLANAVFKQSAISVPGVPQADRVNFSPIQTNILGSDDIPHQSPLPNPPHIVKGIYITGWSAGSTSRINSLIALIKRTELNTAVVDIKDYSGSVSYRTGLANVAATGAENELRISQINSLIKKLHESRIYVIGRITVFQDSILAKAHPEWALQNKTTGKTWMDSKGLAWMDPAGREVWDYNISIAKDALARGFDEINFDYVRFASDGELGQISYPFWDQKTSRAKVIGDFFNYMREGLGNAKLSADLFGLASINKDDLGIGQVIEDAYANFDYVSPMIYPSHFAPGFLGFKNPAQHPYEVIKYSMEQALARLKAAASGNLQIATGSNEQPVASSQLPIAKLRPWLQDFSLGATYDTSMVKKQIQATYDVFLNPSTSSGQAASSDPEKFNGWLLWNASNIYTEEALERE